jgi:hypothetical protein
VPYTERHLDPRNSFWCIHQITANFTGTIANSLTPERASHSASIGLCYLGIDVYKYPRSTKQALLHLAQQKQAVQSRMRCSICTCGLVASHSIRTAQCVSKRMLHFPGLLAFYYSSLFVRRRGPPPPSSAAVSLREHGLYLEAYSTLNRKIKSEPGPPARALHLDPVAASDRPSTGCLDSFSSEVPHRIRAISPLGT